VIQKPIYLDYAATCPMDQRVVDAMLPTFTQVFGNAASRTHVFGWKAEEAVEQARAEVAGLIGADPKEITWTSGATEANNLAIKGAVEFLAESGKKHIITVVTEHKAVLDTCKYLERHGYEVTYLPVNLDGLITVEQVEAAIRPDTAIVSVMFANNETGVIQPIAEIGALCHKHGVLFHTDAVQAYGKVPLDVEAMNIDLLSMSAHKVYGPKGVGALYVRRRRPRVRLAPQIHGGGHERGNRSGTLNVSGIVGFGAAARLARELMAEESARITEHPRAPADAPDDGDPARDAQRVGGAPPAGHAQHQLRVRRGREPADGSEGRRHLVGLGVHVGEPGAELRAEGDGPRRRAGPLEPADHGRPVHHARGGRLHRRPDQARGRTPARDVAAVGDGPGGHRPADDRVDAALETRQRSPTPENPMAYSTRSSITTNTRATSAASTRRTRASAPASSARPPAATS
jgi:cysteine sulfinate desulfinase/cysteine desulfurase-like protein